MSKKKTLLMHVRTPSHPCEFTCRAMACRPAPSTGSSSAAHMRLFVPKVSHWQQDAPSHCMLHTLLACLS